MNAPLRILEWQILSNNPGLYGREGMNCLREEEKRAWERGDYRRIKALSGKRLLFERCRMVGPEEAFFGRNLGGSERQSLEAAVGANILDSMERSRKHEENLEWENAIRVIGRTLDTTDGSEHRIVAAELKVHLGTLLWNSPAGDRAENLERAIALNREASKVFTRRVFPEYWAMIRNNLANTYLFRIRGDRAENLEVTIELFEQALGVVTREAFPEQWATTRYNLANTYLLRIHGDRERNMDRAIELYRSILEVRTKQAFPEDWARVQNSLALAYCERKRGDRGESVEMAIRLFEKSLEVFSRDVFPLHWARTQSNLARAYMSRGVGDPEENIRKGIERIEGTLDIFSRRAYPEYWAKIHYYLGRANLDLARRGRLEKIDLAVEQLERALEVQVPTAFPRECRRTSILLSESHLLCGRWDDALESLHLAREADRLIQRQATSLTGRTHEIEEGAILYYLASLACARQGDLIGSVEWLEQGKTRELEESLARDRAIFAKNLGEGDRRAYAGKLERLRALEAEQRGAIRTTRTITEVGREAHRIHEELDRLIEEIQEYEPDFLRETTVDLEEIRSILTDDGVAFLVFNTTRYGTVIILLTLLGGAFFSRAFFLDDFTTETMNDLIEEWSARIETLRHGRALTVETRRRWWKEIDEIGRSIYRHLISHVHGWLLEKGAEIRELVMVPHLSLHVLPLHLARYDRGGESRYLIEDYRVRYLPSLSVIIAGVGAGWRPSGYVDGRGGSRVSGTSRMLLVCDPTGDLLWSHEEVRRVEECFSGHKEVISGKTATKENFLTLAPGSRLLHLSGHGEFDPVDPWNSGLVLAADEVEADREEREIGETVRTRDRQGRIIVEERSYHGGGGERMIYGPLGKIRTCVRSLPDGRRYLPGRGRLLTLREIFTEMDLSEAELVVLSACESGLVGYGGKSDEFVGLPGGFIRAGARRVMASLWVVDDEATATLMEHFYRHLLSDRYSPALALKTAQLKIRKNPRWRNPFYWGAFRILGV